MEYITKRIFTNIFSLAWGNKQLVVNSNCVKMKACFFHMRIIIMSMMTGCQHIMFFGNAFMEIALVLNSLLCHVWLVARLSLQCGSLRRVRDTKNSNKVMYKLCEGVRKGIRTLNENTMTVLSFSKNKDRAHAVWYEECLVGCIHHKPQIHPGR